MRLALALILAAGPATAEECTETQDAYRQLAENHHEQRVGAGTRTATVRKPPSPAVIETTFVYELWASPEGSWTVLRTDARGMSCIVASGDNWTSFPSITGDPA